MQWSYLQYNDPRNQVWLLLFWRCRDILTIVATQPGDMDSLARKKNDCCGGGGA